MDRYPVAWGEKTLHLSNLTGGIKRAFCDWVVLRLRTDAEADYAGYPAKRNEYLDGLRARVWWVAGRMSPTTWEWLYKSHEGGRQYARLLLGVGEKEMPDAELDEFLDAKEADPASDYMVALALIHEDANPKAKARPANTSAPTGT